LKRRLFRIAALLMALALVGFLVVALGLVPVTASSGHWPITEWFLHFAMKRSVATHSLFIESPPLDDPALILKGATHYHTGCRSCHGSPEIQSPVIAQSMTPAAPNLASKVGEWKPEQLFYIVKHGVKFTGMPAWPAQQRDDEVWAMVAFLLKFPKLDAAGYRSLALGDEVAAAETEPLRALEISGTLRATLRESCAHCHGTDGFGRGTGSFPRLAGQRSDYLRNALNAYARGERFSGTMQPIAAALGPDTIRELANHYASLPPSRPSQGGDPAAIARGEAIAHHGIPSQRVPSCVDCHGPNPARPNSAYPLHAGQDAAYLVLQLELFKNGRRGGSSYARLMRPIAARLTAEQMRDVAAYYTSLPAAGAAQNP
jgi:cytochrome c553